MRRWHSSSVRALTTRTFTTRAGAGNDLARENYSFTVGDLAASEHNRARLQTEIAVPIQWLNQVHGIKVLELKHGVSTNRPDADAALTQLPGTALAILTADCMPIVIADRGGTAVAVAHAGWRGLLSGVIEATLEVFLARGLLGENLQAFIAPCIGPTAFEVGPEVREAFADVTPLAERDEVARCFVPSISLGSSGAFGSPVIAGRGDRFLADLAALALTRFARFNVLDVQSSRACTFSDPAHFYSHRYWYQHQNLATGQGRQATVVWIAPPPLVDGGAAFELGYQKYS